MKIKDILKMKYSPRTFRTGPGIMYNISNAVIFRTSLKEFYITLQKELGQVFDTKNMFICSYNEEEDSISLPYLVDEKNNVDVLSSMSASGTLTGYMIHEDRPMLISENEINSLLKSGKIDQVGSVCKIWMGIPLKIMDKTTGALVVQHYDNPKAYGKKDLELLSFISAQVSMSIETKRLNENVKIEKAYFKQLFEDSPECMVLASKEGKLIRVNEEFENLFGFCAKDALGKNINDLIVPEALKEEFQELLRLLAQGEKLVQEHILQHKDGSGIDVSMIASSIDIDGGEPIIFSLYRDISEQKSAQLALQKSEEKLRNILQSSPNAISISDLRGDITEFNQAALEIFEADDPVQLMGKNGNDFVIPAQKDKGKKLYLEVYRKGIIKNAEIEILTLKGKHKYFEMSASLIHNKDGKPIGIATINQDISTKKNAEKALREHEQLLNQITSSAKDGIIVLDNEGHVIFWNKSAEKIFGYPASEILGEDFHKIIVPSKYHEAHDNGFKTFRKTGKGGAIGATLELEAIHRNGMEFPVELSLSGMEMNERWHSVGIIRDITQRKEFEEKLEEAKTDAENANRAKSEFLANMSHEIRTPMNAILGFSEILESQIGKDSRVKEYVSGIRNSGKGLLGLINDILDLSKIEAGRLDIVYEPINPFNIIEEIRQIFSLKTQEKNLDFQINVDQTLPLCLLFDETRLRQVLFNLIGNAVKFTSEGGIMVNVKSKDLDNIASHVNITLEVVDTGIGIHPNQQKAIFEPFRQQDGQSNRKYGGTGLGLSITQRLVDLMGGSLEIESTPGEGSTFTVDLPHIQVASIKESSQGEEDTTAGVIFQDQNILLVEDIETNRQLVYGYLNEHRVTIFEAENGSTAINKAREIKPDLILMDIQMPVMDGIEASRRIKSDQKLKNIPIVALTASVIRKEKDEVHNLCDGYLQKPVSKGELMAELKKHLAFTILENMKEETSMKNNEEGYRDPVAQLKTMLSSPREIPVEFKPLFNKGIIPEYQELAKNRSNKRIRNFARKLIETGSILGLSELEAYGKDLTSQVDVFNIKQIGHLLDGFEEFKEAVQNT